VGLRKELYSADVANMFLRYYCSTRGYEHYFFLKKKKKGQKNFWQSVFNFIADRKVNKT